MITLIIGGSGSGKSRFAEDYVLKIAGSLLGDSVNRPALWYMATMAAGDKESRRRILRHRKMRDGKGFQTIEQPRGIGEKADFIAENGGGIVLLECLSNLAANEMFSDEMFLSEMAEEGSGTDIYDITSIKERILKDISTLEENVSHLVIVSNDIFSDGITYDGTTTAYMELLAELNIAIAKRAASVIEVASACPVYIKGSPDLIGDTICM